MIFLVEMDFVKSGDVSEPADGIRIIEQILQPTLEICAKWKREGRIVAGGPVSGTSRLVFLLSVESPRELDLKLMSLPMWAVAQTKASPLLEFDERGAHIARKAERLKALIDWPGHAKSTDPL